MKKLPFWITAPLVAGTFALLVWHERRRPLRRENESKLTRSARNLTIAALTGAVLTIAEKPVIEPLAALVEKRRWGLLKQFDLPRWLEVPLAVLLMDYTLYLWHVLTHKVPFLWRFHLVHHIDLDLDATTALRFHFAEMTISVPYRAAQIMLIGVSPLSFSVWQAFLFVSILFHHSNARLPIEIERKLNRLIVTPRMHGIHHSIKQEETDSNWSSGLTVWDWLHGTLRLNVPQEEIVIGVPDYRDPAEVTLGEMLAVPFRAEKTASRLPGGDKPERRQIPADIQRIAP